MVEDCPFCKIVRGDLPAKKLYEDSETLAFLDIKPSTKGHALVIPKNHASEITDLDEKTASSLINSTIKVAKAIEKALSPAGINLIQSNRKAAGQVVPHVHIHIIPRYKHDDFQISYNKKEELSEETGERIKKKIKEKLA